MIQLQGQAALIRIPLTIQSSRFGEISVGPGRGFWKPERELIQTAAAAASNQGGGGRAGLVASYFVERSVSSVHVSKFIYSTSSMC